MPTGKWGVIQNAAKRASFNGKLFNHGALQMHDKRLRAAVWKVTSTRLNTLWTCCCMVSTNPSHLSSKCGWNNIIFYSGRSLSAAIECHRCSYIPCSGDMTWHVMFSAWFNIIRNSSVGVFSHAPQRLSCEWTRFLFVHVCAGHIDFCAATCAAGGNIFKVEQSERCLHRAYGCGDDHPEDLRHVVYNTIFRSVSHTDEHT